jgi:hypothetical protein
MNPASIIKQAAAEGVNLALSLAGKIKATGERAAVNHWLPVIREHNSGILMALRQADNDSIKPTPSDERTSKMIAKLGGDPGLIYAMETHFNIYHEVVILTLAIRGKGACELRIPQSRYDGCALFELFEKHTTKQTLP